MSTIILAAGGYHLKTLRYLVVATVFCVLAGSAFAQTPSVGYVYDDLGRLTAVVDPDGNAAVYVYDAVGNLLQIQRIDAPAQGLAITYVSPGRGMPGASVVVFGRGFDPVAANNTLRFFNNVTATVTEASANRLVTSVPTGAATGRISVTNSLGSANSPSDFVVGGTLTVSPASTVLAPGQAAQFQASEGGVPTGSVTWAVNGITGGDARIGTISAAGLYTGPVWVPPGARRTVVTVTATVQADRASSAAATVSLINPERLVPAAGGVSVQVVDGQMFVQSVDGGVSVVVQDGTTFVGSGAVTVSVVPAITAVTPTTAARSTTTTVTLIGAGLTGATSLTATPATGLTFANLQITNDTTATVQITSGTQAGSWALQITGAGGTSTREGTGGNVFTVAP
ncbi:MAG TPA: hypothetical protein VK548_03540 [Candidatus Acidoferrum sp.]|nr:hypothetical protein [Candidatus Acidoferrum sp.]